MNTMEVNFDYSLEPLRDIFLIDVKSFYASVECVMRGLHPLKAMLVVMSTADNTGNGLVLASSPMAKQVLGISNVTRADNIPDDARLEKVPPRMNLYIEKNLKVNDIFRAYVADEDLLIYSIDESILDVTASLNLFFPDLTMSRKEKRWRLARKIQLHVRDELGLYLTVGIGDNPLLAKLALDNESKHNKGFIAEWTYQDVETKLWGIKEMTDFWGIGNRMKDRFNRMGIYSIMDLANWNPGTLKERFGVMGLQYYHHANGIDRTIISEPDPITQEKSYGNSQVLHRDYVRQKEIEVVVREMAEQVAARIRRHHCQTQCVHLFIGTSFNEPKKGFSHQMKIPPTNVTKDLSNYVLFLFRKYYEGQTVRHIGVTYSKLLYTDAIQMSLFDEPEQCIEDQNLDKVLDLIREKYGFTSVVHATSMLEGARSIARAGLVGGHAGGAGGLDGL